MSPKITVNNSDFSTRDSDDSSVGFSDLEDKESCNEGN